ncbi:amino acid permease domain-containing protein [Phthorimaea operculella]|nr:amino acid permease domain-containing protein [Phthorimaea operculella]
MMGLLQYIFQGRYCKLALKFVTKPATMAETLDPLSPSLNSAPSSGFVNKLRSRFSRGLPPRAPGEGYVEFGEFRAERQGVKKVGTFAGVFCPVVLSMFSALIFIRMGYLVGNAGLLVTLAQFVLAFLIVVFTVTSICAISTNGAVEGGGVYFMLSRTMGPEFGGAVGTLFFFANVASSALCISACTEALVENFGPKGYLVHPGSGLPDGWWYRFLYRSVLNALGLAVSLAGAKLFARTSLAIWATMTVCLGSAFISFFVTKPQEVEKPDTNTLTNVTSFNYTGLSVGTLYSNLYPQYGQDYTTDGGQMVDFASVFGVLFTGVTGVMAGANMSGELLSPARSIPRGTLTALLFTFVSYCALSVLTAASCARDLLQNNYVYLLPINVWPPFIALGMIIATFSAGLSNLIGASRVLEALAKDDIFGVLLRPMVTRSSNPVLAVIASWLLVQLGIIKDSLNAIAQINSVLFMTSYFAINLACLGLDLASAPNFRPSFKHFSWVTSFLGLSGCAAVMFALRPAHACGAALACGCLVVGLHLMSPAAAAPKWGSLSQALIFHQVRKYLLLLDPRREHVKFWRPQMLLLIASPRQAAPLIDFVNDQKKLDPRREHVKFWRPQMLLLIASPRQAAPLIDFVNDQKKLDPRREHVKFWRPQMLLLIASPRQAAPLIDFVNDQKKGGLFVLGHVRVGELDGTGDPLAVEHKYWLKLIDHLKVKAFTELCLAESIRSGAAHLTRLAGLGAMKPDTVLLGFRDTATPKDFFRDPSSPYKTDMFDLDNGETVFPLRRAVEPRISAAEYTRIVSDVLCVNKNVCLCRHFHHLDMANVER